MAARRNGNIQPDIGHTAARANAQAPATTPAIARCLRRLGSENAPLRSSRNVVVIQPAR